MHDLFKKILKGLVCQGLSEVVALKAATFLSEHSLIVEAMRRVIFKSVRECLVLKMPEEWLIQVVLYEDMSEDSKVFVLGVLMDRGVSMPEILKIASSRYLPSAVRLKALEGLDLSSLSIKDLRTLSDLGYRSSHVALMRHESVSLTDLVKIHSGNRTGELQRLAKEGIMRNGSPEALSYLASCDPELALEAMNRLLGVKSLPRYLVVAATSSTNEQVRCIAERALRERSQLFPNLYYLRDG